MPESQENIQGRSGVDFTDSKGRLASEDLVRSQSQYLGELTDLRDSFCR